MKRILTSLLMLASLGAQSQTTVTDGQIATLNSATTIGTVSIHDPSIVYSPANKTYYIWGSHLGNARSTDLKSWTVMHNSIWYDPYFIHLAHQGDATGTACNVRDAFNIQQVTKTKNYLGAEVDMPNIDAEAYANRYAAPGDEKEWFIDGNMWAPDIIYNPTMEKWCLYLSINGPQWNSIIILLTSNSAEGPWTYQGPIVMGGFNGNTGAPAISETDLNIAIGTTSIPSRYNLRNGWGNYWPNCIDPCVFFDETGELWMAYGSWSGGIFMLKLDKETGLNDYQYNYTNNPSDYTSKGQNGVKDPYFGRKIAGGYYVSGEGPYIKHIGDYYYLFMSYGGFGPREGYEMRIFRSSSPLGPYNDAAGRSALYTGYVLNHNTASAVTNDTRGIKLMGAFTGWGEMQTQGWNSQGHNSAVVNPQTNQAFVVYHTKYNDGTAGHLVHIQQLFLNESGWPVAAPFAYNGEKETLDTPKTSHYTTDDIIGEWHVMRHYYKMRQDSTTIANRKPVMVTLKEDGTVKGEQSTYNGTWSLKDGTDYITLALASGTYQGVLCSNSMNGDSRGAEWTGNNHKTISFTCVDNTNSSNSGTPIWGYKLEPKSAIAYNHTKLTLPSTTSVLSGNLNVYTDMEENVVENWTSTNTDILSNTGKFRAPDAVPSTGTITVKFTGELTCGDYAWSKTFSWSLNSRNKKIAVGQADGDYLNGLVAYYDFNEEPAVNLKDNSQIAAVDKAGTGTVPAFETDSAYRCGMVLHQYFGAKENVSYTRMDNPLKGQNLDGATVSLWVKRLDSNVWDALWSFFNSTSSTDVGERLFLTGNSYLGYNNNAGAWFDINHPNDVTSENIPEGEWTLVTYTFDETGVKLYINGEFKEHEAFNSNSGTAAEAFDYSKVLDWLSSANYFYLGMGSFWGSAPAEFDDVLIYNRALTQEDITGLNTMENRDYNFASGQYTPTGIFSLEEEEPAVKKPVDGRIYDLNGRILNATPRKGIYIQDGKKKIAL